MKRAPAKRKPARDVFTPTEEQRDLVKRCHSYGFIEPDICLLVINPKTGKGISGKLLHQHFRHELDTGHLDAAQKVCGVLFKAATGSPAVVDDDGNVIEPAVPPNLTAAMFWAKTRLQWRETAPVSAVEFKKGAGGAVNVTVTNYAA